MDSHTLHIRLLGDFEIRIGERVIPDDVWKLRKAAGIVKMLALEPTHRLHREQILDTLWPDLDPDAAANNFRYALHTARRILDSGGTPLRDGQHLTLGSPDAVQVDVQAFEAAVDAAWRNNDPADFQTASNLYVGDLLPTDLYEEWLDARRTSLRTSYMAVLARLAGMYEELDDPARAIEAWQGLVTADPLREDACARLMLLLAQSGRRDEALARFDTLRDILDRELGVAPEPVTRQLAEAIRDGTLGAISPPPPIRQRSSRLPAQTTSLIGRQREVAEVRQALAASRIVTLTGPGGAGKTRLAISVAEELRPDFPDGVYFVQLAAISQADFVVSAIAQELGLTSAHGQSPMDQLLQFLEDRSALLVLDNFEHVLPATPEVSQILEASARTAVLATSRIPLRIRGERIYPLRSLTDDAAVTLFIERSRDAIPGFEPDADQIEAIREICQRLDGLPLAIELAAARSNILSPHALLARIEQPLNLLTDGARDLPDRQRTLRAAIAWSYDLLNPQEQVLFQNLAVFRGGWTLDAAEVMCAGEIDPLTGLSSLVDSSLVERLATSNGEPRFQMLETIREFGLEQLTASGNEEDVQREHARHFAGMVAQAPPFLHGPEQPDWLNRFEREHANIQAALTCLADHDVETGLKMISGLWRFWWMRGHVSIGKRFFDQFLALADDTVEPLVMALTLTGAGVMTEYESELSWEQAGTLYEQALSIWLDLENPPEGAHWCYLGLGIIATRYGDFQEAEAHFRAGMAYAERHDQTFEKSGGLLLLGTLASIRGEVDEATSYFTACLEIARQFNDPWIISMATGNLGLLRALQGRYDEARTIITESLEVHRLLGHSRDIAGALDNLGWIAIREGDLLEASELFEEGLTAALQSNDQREIGAARSGQANVALRQGNVKHALDLFRQSLTDFRNAGEPVGIAGTFEGLASTYRQIGDLEHATRLHAASAAYRLLVGIPLAEAFRADVEQDLAALRGLLPDEQFQTVWESGLALTPDQIAAMEELRANRLT
jgi:predicted ATPase/DNA-binding SARP family transcriptional activator